MKTVPTWTAVVWVGLYDSAAGQLAGSAADVFAACQEYADAVGLCVTVTPTTFVYTGGSEPGAAVGVINYPRFPSTPDALRGHALALAARLRERFRQRRVTVVMPGETVMLGDTR